MQSAHGAAKRSNKSACEQGAPGAPDGNFIVSGNQITQAGYTQGRYENATQENGQGSYGIYAGSLQTVQITGNQISGGRGDGIFASGLHFVVSANVLSGGGFKNATGIQVVNSVDMDIANNNLRGYGQAILATDRDTIRIRGNTIDASHSPTATAVVVKSGVKRVAVTDNAITGGDAERCVDVGGLGLHKVKRDNLCW